MSERPMTFEEWWYDYRAKNGWSDTKQRRALVMAGWRAAADQGIPGYVYLTLVAAHSHTSELREAWQRGVIDERDGGGAVRSNRNIDVEVATRRALELMPR